MGVSLSDLERRYRNCSGTPATIVIQLEEELDSVLSTTTVTAVQDAGLIAASTTESEFVTEADAELGDWWDDLPSTTANDAKHALFVLYKAQRLVC